MDTFRPKRKRSENWENEEKVLLQKLIAEYIEIVEDKRTNSHSSQKKREAWAHILKRFNAVNKRKRELNQLHFQWRNTKCRLKANDISLQYKLSRDSDGSKEIDPKVQNTDVMMTPKEEFEAAEYDVGENDLQRVKTKDELYKNKLFLLNKKLKETELQYTHEVHAAKITSIEMERELKLHCMQEEHNAKIKMINRSNYLM